VSVYIGIDNGVSGAIVALSESHGRIIAMTPTPIKKSRKGNEVDMRAVFRWLSEELPGFQNGCFVIEEPNNAQTKSTAASMAGSFHAFRGMFEVKFYRWHRVTPQEWQKKMLPGCAAGDTKPRARAKAAELWPEETFLANGKSKKPHEGLIDAALIAEYGRISNL
jgi:hypothetical protein